MSDSQVQVIGADHVQAALDDLARRTEDVSTPSRTLADLGVETARNAAPRRTGALAASITPEVDTKSAGIRTDIEYAPFVEFGTQYIAGDHYMAAGLDAMGAQAESVYGAWLGDQITDVSR